MTRPRKTMSVLLPGRASDPMVVSAGKGPATLFARTFMNQPKTSSSNQEDYLISSLGRTAVVTCSASGSQGSATVFARTFMNQPNSFSFQENHLIVHISFLVNCSGSN